MPREALLQQCQGRALAGDWTEASASDCRRRLMESDRAFGQHYPEGDLSKMSKQTLRAAVKGLGIQDRDEINDVKIENLRNFGRYLAAMRGRDAFGTYLAEHPDEKEKAYDLPFSASSFG